MNNYCKHLKKKNNKPYCKLAKKEITLSQCQQCVNKEYRIPVKGKMVKKSAYEWKKSPLMSGNAQKNKKNVQNSKISGKFAQKLQKMQLKSKKMAKLEKNRFSVFTTDLEHCYLCGRKKEELHEIYAGRNRINSMKYGFVLPLCHECHSQNQNNSLFNEFWHKGGQIYWEFNIGSRNEFLAIFRRNYLD